MKRQLAAASLGITLGTGGCATAGRGIDNDIRVKLAPPGTSRADAKTLFGDPAAIAPILPARGPCIEEWRCLGPPSGPIESLVIRFDHAGKVCSWTTAESFTSSAM